MAGFPRFVLVCAVLAGTQVAAELLCVPSNSSEMTVTFDSHRNKTGRWTHEIGLEHPELPSGYHNRNSVPWTVDVQYVPRKCDEKLKDSLKVLISFSESQYVATDYLHIPGLGYYKYYSTPAAWTAAKATCEQDGAHLAILNSQQEADELKKLVVNTSNDWVWIGLFKNGTNSEFVSVLGEPVSKTGFANWNSGYPPTNAGVNSGALLHKTKGNMAYDPKTITNVFLCEQQ